MTCSRHAGRATRLIRAMLVRAIMIPACALAVSACQQGFGAKLPSADALPQPQTSYLDLGRTLLQQDRIDLARDAFIRSLRTEGVTSAALTGAGIAAERQGLLRDAKSFFQGARRIEPESVLANNNLGVVHYRLGEFHAAHRAFKVAFALSSGSSEVAERNLALAEMAIARSVETSDVPVRNPIQLQRLGSGAYKLEPDRKTAGQG